MKMTSMKLSPKESKEMMKPQVGKDGPSYPYGLRLNLDRECIDKLNMGRMPKIGSEVTILAKAKVESVSERDSTDSGKHRTLELQITELGLETPKLDAAEYIYGSEKGTK